MLRKPIFIIAAVLVFGLVLGACGPGEPQYSAEQITIGQSEYTKTCSACHGPDARGLDNLGKTLIGSEFVNEQTDAELLAYVKAGRAVDDPLNTTGIAMPPKGGNPALTDEQINAIVAYVRSIQE